MTIHLPSTTITGCPRVRRRERDWSNRRKIKRRWRTSMGKTAVEFLVTREINDSLLLNADSKAPKSKWKLKLDRDSNRHTNSLSSSWHGSISASVMEELTHLCGRWMHLQRSSHSFGCATPSVCSCFQQYLHRLVPVLRWVRLVFQGGRAHFKSLRVIFHYIYGEYM